MRCGGTFKIWCHQRSNYPGSQGVFLANSDQKQLLKATSVSAIDTTAAGDCFNGAVLQSYPGMFPN